MTATSGNTPSTSESQKLFDNYGPVNVREAIGTFFLGILAILLFIALMRSKDLSHHSWSTI